MIEIALLFCIILFSVFSNKKYILYLFLFLLPFHTFIKSVFEFYYEGGNIFSVWKELVVLILIAKIYSGPRLRTDKLLFLLIQVFFLIIFVFYFMARNYSDPLATLRDHIFPVLLFIAIYSLPLDIKTVRGAVMSFSIAVFINGVMGFVQNFFLNLQISTMMGRIDHIDSSGYIQYKTTSARILGIERMSGILGGPNTFGIFFSFAVLFLFGILLNEKKFGFSSLFRKVLRVTFLISALCLLFSFSRAGWVIAGLGGLILLKVDNNKINYRYLIFGIPIVITIVFSLIEYFPQVEKVIVDSLSGKEASAADRTNNFARGLEKNLAEPFGHGLGTTDLRYKTHEFFTESAFMNIAYEIGILGLFYLLFLHYKFLSIMYRFKNFEFRPFARIAIALSIPTIITCFVSINPYGMPSIYLWWLVLGLGLNNSKLILSERKRKTRVYTSHELVKQV